MTVRVLGVGSPAGDDRAGWLVAQSLAAREVTVPGLEVAVEALDRPGPALALALDDAELAIVVDAAAPAGQPGRLSVHEADALEINGAEISSHALGVGAALALAGALDALPARLVVVAIEAGACAPTSEVSAAVRASVPRAVERIESLIRAAGTDRAG